MKRFLVLIAVVAAACSSDIKKKPTNGTPNNQNNQNSQNSQTNSSTNVATNSSTNTGTNSATNAGTNSSTNNGNDDFDGDGVPNATDNCPRVENVTQTDTDGDSVGDACDNCPDTANVGQADADADGQGDVCTGDHYYTTARDSDADAVFDVVDNCPDVANGAQTDLDGDSVGDVCDNCPNTANYDQTDSDSDGEGDSCSTRPTGTECPVSVQPLEPDVWLLIDNSGSMSDDLGTYLPALTNFTDAYADTTRFGLSGQSDSGTICTDTEYLDLGDWTATQLGNTISAIQATGPSTPNIGLHEIDTGDYLTDPTDPFTEQRSKSVIMMTDNAGNSCDDVAMATDAAAALAAQDITVHVIGYLWDNTTPTQWLADVSNAGGGSRHLIDTPNDLTATLTSIRQAIGDSCVYALADVPDPNKVWVSVSGAYLTRDSANGFELDVASGSVTLLGTSCDLASSGAAVEITTGCETPCEPEDEVCDYVDNDCDMVADESCQDCAPEVCNGVDDDCDDQTDEGCP